MHRSSRRRLPLVPAIGGLANYAVLVLGIVHRQSGSVGDRGSEARDLLLDARLPRSFFSETKRNDHV
jgi:hypothetical protein